MLSKAEKILIAVIAIYTLAATMVSTFANVYLLTYTKSLIIMSIYALIRYGVLALGALIAAKLSVKVKFSNILLAGLIFIILAVITLLLVSDYLSEQYQLVYLIGAIWGFGEGFFWISVNTMIQLLTSYQSRWRFIGLNGSLSNMVTIIAPLLSSLILKVVKLEHQGYLLIFISAVGLFILTAILATFLAAKASGQPFSVWANLKSLKTDFAWRQVVLAQFVLGIRDAASIALAGLLIYSILADGSLYGQVLSIFALLATLSQYLSSRLINHHNYRYLLMFGSVGIFLSGLCLIFWPTFSGVLTYGVLHSLAVPFCLNGFSILAMGTISQYLETENVIGRTATRELMIGAGRVLGFFIVILSSQLVWLSWRLELAFFLLYASSLLFAGVIYRYQRHSPVLGD